MTRIMGRLRYHPVTPVEDNQTAERLISQEGFLASGARQLPMNPDPT